MKRLTRREALKLGVVAGGALLLPTTFQRRSLAGDPESPVTAPFTLPFKVPPVLQPVKSDNTPGTNGALDFTGTDYYTITQRPGQQEIIPGYKSTIWGYNGIFPGPTIKQRKGRQSVVRQINNLPQGHPTSTHLHGMAALPQYDGYAEDLLPLGYYKDYYYPNNRAATIWYHDHAIHHTAYNVYQGLAGFYIIQDDEEDKLPLPKGQYDVPLFIHDKQFANNGAVIYDTNGEKEVMGDVITVNGVAWPKMEVANRKYRFRMLNGSISRAYRPALSTGEPLIMIGTDAGLMASPQPVQDFRISPAERYEFIIDFSKYKIGTRVVLRNLSLPLNDDYSQTNVIMCFDVVRQEPDDSLIPNTLRAVEQIPSTASMRTRDWRFERSNGLWVINGMVWDKDRIDANPNLGDYEIWNFYNNAGSWFHPIHVHLVDMQILDRNGKPPLPYEKGWKDVFYVGGNESVRVIARYSPQIGKYMMHCHNTVHEDHDMMTQIEVGRGGPDPITAASAKPLPAPSF